MLLIVTKFSIDATAPELSVSESMLPVGKGGAGVIKSTTSS